MPLRLCVGCWFMKPYYEDDHATIYHGDCLEVMESLGDGSVGLVLSDPPYFRVKDLPWDRQWDTADGFLDWLGSVADGWRRVLAGNGSLYCFASPQMSARVELMLADKFNVLNAVRWQKDMGWHMKSEKEAQRSFLSPWETAVFAEQFGQDTSARGEWTAAEAELRASVFEPLRLKMWAMLAETGWSVRDIAEAYQEKTGTRTVTGMAWHWFQPSQWCLCTSENYRWLQEITGGFDAEYEHLRAEYEHLRRPFNVTADIPYTDVWTFPTVPPGGADRHPCEKPQAMLRHIIGVSHRPDLPPVLDTFMGSGSTLRAAKDMGRKAIGVEADERWCEVAATRLSQEVLDLGV